MTHRTSERAVRACALPALGLLMLTATGCATAGSTFRSGVGDRILDEPPYYAGTVTHPIGPFVHVPIAYQPGASQAAMFDPAAHPDSPITALLAEMNGYLDALGVSTRLEATVRGAAPDVRFGCDQSHLDECIRESDPAVGHGAPWMRLAVGRPSRDWVSSVQAGLQGGEADRVIVITLEVGQYWPHQRNLRGDKEVRLGGDHTVRVPWLTALDQPAQVLQLTGAVMDASGSALRIGAEGLVAKRTNVLLVSFGIHELLSDDDVERLRTAVREDRPGAPLVWQAALRELLAELTGQPELKIR